jgi:hypothetical protein
VHHVAQCAGIMLPPVKDQRILFHMCNKTEVFEIRLYSETNAGLHTAERKTLLLYNDI